MANNNRINRTINAPVIDIIQQNIIAAAKNDEGLRVATNETPKKEYHTVLNRWDFFVKQETNELPFRQEKQENIALIFQRMR